MISFIPLSIWKKLSLDIQEKVDYGQRTLVKISRSDPSFSHLLFADGCLLFTEVEAFMVRLVKNVNMFCKVLGLMFNNQISNFFSLLIFLHLKFISLNLLWNSNTPITSVSTVASLY